MPSCFNTTTSRSQQTDLAIIRKSVKSISGCREVNFSDEKKVLSFLTFGKGVDHSTSLTSDTKALSESSQSEDNDNNGVMKTSQESINVLNESMEIARVNVYYESDVVGVCRILNGEVREIFRRYRSIKTLIEILKNPPNLTYFNYEELGMDFDETSNEHRDQEPSVNSETKPNQLHSPESESSMEYDDSKSTNRFSDTNIYKSSKTIQNEINEAMTKNQLGEIGVAILCAQRDELKKLICSYEETRNIKDEVEFTDKEAKYNRQKNIDNNVNIDNVLSKKKSVDSTEVNVDIEGTETNQVKSDNNHNQRISYLLQLPAKTIGFVKNSLLRVENASVLCATTNGVGTVILYKYGHCVFTNNIPQKLHEKLDIRKRTHVPKPPVYISLGTKNRFYIKLINGDHLWAGCNSMTKYLKACGKEVSSVTFGKKFKSYFIVFSDGSWESGDEIPTGLNEIILERSSLLDFSSVSIGPNQEWFLKTKDGKVLWGGISRKLQARVAQLGDRITNMDFGDGGSYIVQYK